MLRVRVIYLPSPARAKVIARAMATGIAASGDEVTLVPADDVDGEDPGDYDVNVFYGQREPLRTLRETCERLNRRFVYVDLGYWGRREPEFPPMTEHHKVVLDGLHPTRQLNTRYFPGDRFGRFGLEVKPRAPVEPWKHVLLAGMSAKAAWTYHLRTEEWELRVIDALKQLTDRQIVYRPKPSWPDARPLPGTVYGRAGEVEDYLPNTHLVMTHHSNVAIDALVAGVPTISAYGAVTAAVPSFYNYIIFEPEDITDPYWPDDEDRLSFLRGLAYCQWTPEEMARGLPWGLFKEDNLL